MIQELGLVLALATFCSVTLFTPGPNNLMLMASGLNFGFRRALPHLFGVALGFALMVLGVGLGLGAVFDTFPAAYAVLKYCGAAYLLYLAWRIATAAPVERVGAAKGRPLTFVEAADAAHQRNTVFLGRCQHRFGRFGQAEID